MASLVGVACLGLALMLSPATASAQSDAKMTPSQVEERLTCQCGCGLTVATCNHMQCGFAIPAREDIAESLAKGEAGEGIIARYRAEYGEKILSSPTFEGFNILAWVAPYIAVFLGGIGLIWRFRHWKANPEDGMAPAQSNSTSSDPGRLDRLERELEDFDK